MPHGRQLTVVIADAEVLQREGLARLLGEAGMRVQGTTGDAETLIDLVEELRPDVVVTDIRLPPLRTDDGLRAAVRIRARFPGTAVMLLSQVVQRGYALDLIGTTPGGSGYLLKERISDVASFCADVRRVAEGGTALDPAVVEFMVGGAPEPPAAKVPLSARQQVVLALLAQGRSNRAIAGLLGITEKAVIQHSSRIYAALGLAPHADDHRRVLATLTYLSSGWHDQLPTSLRPGSALGSPPPAPRPPPAGPVPGPRPGPRPLPAVPPAPGALR